MKTILIVDQEKNTTFTLQKLLESESFNVFNSQSLREAIAILNAQKLDLVVVSRDIKDGNVVYPMQDQLKGEKALERAETVAKELRACGIAINKVISIGEELPVASNSTEQGRKKNRRVEVWIR
jgi:ActR/RegA family two-component response regulator